MFKINREGKICRSMTTSSIKSRRIGMFHVVVVQWTSKKCTKNVMHVQSSCFAHKSNFSLTLLLLSSSSLLKVPKHLTCAK